jgi:hypothetical protein
LVENQVRLCMIYVFCLSRQIELSKKSNKRILKTFNLSNYINNHMEYLSHKKTPFTTSAHDLMQGNSSTFDPKVFS